MKNQGTNSWKGFGKETYWNEYWREGDTVVQYKCRKAKFFDGDENVHDEDKTEVCSWAVGDLSMPEVVPEFLRTLVFARPRGDDQFADCTFSPSLDMSR